MGFISKALVASGLVVVTGPLSFMAAAQDYVDVEGEKAKAPGATNPYSASPAQSYPATSYGTSGAPAGAPVTATGIGAAPAASGPNLGNLVLQIQQLQQDVMRLNGIVEEQAHELRKLKEQSLERYVDLDKRLGAAMAGGAVVAGNQGGNGGSADGDEAATTGVKREHDAADEPESPNKKVKQDPESSTEVAGDGGDKEGSQAFVQPGTVGVTTINDNDVLSG